MRNKEEILDDSKSLDLAVNVETDFMAHTGTVEVSTTSETPVTQGIQEIQVSQEITDTHESTMTPEAPPQSSTPTLETMPTSTDEHGYEWYTEEMEPIGIAFKEAVVNGICTKARLDNRPNSTGV